MTAPNFDGTIHALKEKACFSYTQTFYSHLLQHNWQWLELLVCFALFYRHNDQDWFMTLRYETNHTVAEELRLIQMRDSGQLKEIHEIQIVTHSSIRLYNILYCPV